jgi:hypothetical protein
MSKRFEILGGDRVPSIQIFVLKRMENVPAYSVVLSNSQYNYERK